MLEENICTIVMRTDRVYGKFGVYFCLHAGYICIRMCVRVLYFIYIFLCIFAVLPMYMYVFTYLQTFKAHPHHRSREYLSEIYLRNVSKQVYFAKFSTLSSGGIRYKHFFFFKL